MSREPDVCRCAQGHDLSAPDAWQRDDGVYRCRLCASRGREPGAWLQSTTALLAAARPVPPAPARTRREPDADRPCPHEGQYLRDDGRCERCMRAAYNRTRRARAKAPG